ncbi:MerR family transcriptional regulator [Clostridium ihumii]|uniref:MerR family transcriptional regulator n=1 Tax=Clostridium ihumii TaxID=1470356 RepID=UPI00055636A6|nr:MerR family transcriptional regulator [Clostridium ihumii]
MIKDEFLMVGELAKKMGVSVRTLQYYDKEGLLKPSAISEGGRRLYSCKDIIRLHQILSFKYLGFSLKEIKSKIFFLDTPQEVANVLEFQMKSVESQIEALKKVNDILSSLQTEISKTGKVDFVKYSEIIEMMRVKNDGYWVWKNFDDTIKEHIKNRFADNHDIGIKIYETYKSVLDESLELKNRGISPESEEGIAVAQKWWNMIMEFTGGDMSLLPELEKFNQNKENWDSNLADKQKEVDSFLESALSCYLSKLNLEI